MVERTRRDDSPMQAGESRGGVGGGEAEQIWIEACRCGLEDRLGIKVEMGSCGYEWMWERGAQGATGAGSPPNLIQDSHLLVARVCSRCLLELESHWPLQGFLWFRKIQLQDRGHARDHLSVQ